MQSYLSILRKTSASDQGGSSGAKLTAALSRHAERMN
jgi:hypothetical protein